MLRMNDQHESRYKQLLISPHAPLAQLYNLKHQVCFNVFIRIMIAKHSMTDVLSHQS
jgi:hypothetical protein